MPQKPRDRQDRQAPGAQQSAAAVARSFQRGEPEAVRIVRARVSKILAFRGYGMPVTDREDLEQEVLAQIWQAVRKPGFDSGTRFWGFVETVTARRCIDWLRTRKTLMVLDFDPPISDSDPLEATLAAEKIQLAYAALAELPKPCRDLIILHAGLNKPYKEIASILGKSEGALRVQMHRCVQEARRVLSKMVTSSGSNAEMEEAR